MRSTHTAHAPPKSAVIASTAMTPPAISGATRTFLDLDASAVFRAIAGCAMTAHLLPSFDCCRDRARMTAIWNRGGSLRFAVTALGLSALRGGPAERERGR